MRSRNKVSRTKPTLHDDLLADQGQCLNLRCEQCPVQDSRIRLDFAIKDHTKLLVNGFELYPSHDEDREPLITAIVQDSNISGTEPHEETISYQLNITTVEKDETENIELIDIHYETRQVGHLTVKDVPAVHVRLIKLSTEEVLIGALSAKDNYETDCSTMQCWAYKFTLGPLRSSDEAMQQCCSRSSGKESHNPTDINWHHEMALRSGNFLLPGDKIESEKRKRER
ncbi:hypothetical protein QQS21_000501 [Conoideocrella luteorostrata]|uniref:DUF7728 domain-containing protein n=1 Tax=Conoideocrella luteorostrata TaxID=1105319 RepID=A0AAJ0CZ00_9HYPO|nr:hypothetical protein QQS21_000501 [Conoideocrella luteorostrata]